MPFPISGSGIDGELTIDYAELGAVMRSAEIRAIVTEAAHAVAAELGGDPEVDRVWVNSYTTDRAAASVTIPGYTGDMELKYGALRSAAAGAGLEVSG